MTPYMPQQNGPVERGLSRAIKAGDAARLQVKELFPNIHLERLKGVREFGWLKRVDGVCFVGIRGVEPLRDDGEQRHTFPARSIIRGPPANANFAVLQAGVQSRFTAEENGPPGAPCFFLNSNTIVGVTTSGIWTQRRR